MKLLDKIKNAIFEEEEFDEEFQHDEEMRVKKNTYQDSDEELKRNFRKRAMEERAKAENEGPEADRKFVDDIVKQIDVDKTVPKRAGISEETKEEVISQVKETKEEPNPMPKRESRRAPIIFDDTDFDEGVKEIKKNKAKEIDEEKGAGKNLYGGYRDEKVRERFKPSPNISPVYGLVEVSPVLEKASGDSKENHVYVPHKQEEVSLDDVRQKAFGSEPYFEEDDDLGLLYEMEKDDKPAVSRVTIGDAEEYFDDLGLEYNVDYTDKKVLPKETRSTKNKELTEKVETEIKLEETKELNKIKKGLAKATSEDTGEIETLDELEITKEQIKPRTAAEIKKIKKVEESEIEKKEDEDPDEKNLYDLIDMMYDSE